MPRCVANAFRKYARHLGHITDENPNAARPMLTFYCHPEADTNRQSSADYRRGKYPIRWIAERD